MKMAHRKENQKNGVTKRNFDPLMDIHDRILKKAELMKLDIPVAKGSCPLCELDLKHYTRQNPERWIKVAADDALYECRRLKSVPIN